MSRPFMLPSVETKPTMRKKFLVALLTLMPWAVTSAGNCASASCSLFCTCTWAMLGSVPCLKVQSISIVPFDWVEEEMYSSPSSPESCCWIGLTTVWSTVSAEAPG